MSQANSGQASTMLSQIRRRNVVTGSQEPFEIGQIPLRVKGVWRGVTLERWASGPGDMPESTLAHPVLTVNCGLDPIAEVRWAGHRPLRRRMHPGAVSIFPCWAPYRAASCEPAQSLVLQLDSALLGDGGRHWDVALRPALAIDDAYLRHAVLCLADDAIHRSPVGALYGESLTAAVVAHLAKNHGTRTARDGAPGSLSAQQKRRLDDYIAVTLDQAPSLAELSQIAGCDNAFTFVKAFKAAFGLPPHQYVIRQRVRTAKQLLGHSAMPLAEIALRCGFSSQSHFSTVFRRLAGTTPRRYRNGLAG